VRRQAKGSAILHIALPAFAATADFAILLACLKTTNSELTMGAIQRGNGAHIPSAGCV
jgi:hypothetical protein